MSKLQERFERAAFLKGYTKNQERGADINPLQLEPVDLELDPIELQLDPLPDLEEVLNISEDIKPALNH